MIDKQKILYFRYFFCGREDVYAFRVPGSGYRPRRRPEYDLTDSMIMSHMDGKVMLGSYPIMKNGMTRWVAADFDGKNNNAFEEAFVLKEALESHGIETICNSSQSGKGVHVRVIFEEYVEAWIARNLMSAFITLEDIKSISDGGAFDRLFPTQDEIDPMDAKSIGNQIAMPLNAEAAIKRGGSMLLDNDFERLQLGDQTWDALELYDRVARLTIFDALADIGMGHLAFIGPESVRRAAERSRPAAPRSESSLGGRRNRGEGGKASDLYYIFQNCEFMQHGLSGGLSYDEWWMLAAILTRFDGHGGRRLWHQISSMDSRYNSVQADKKYDNILLRMHAPVTCVKIASMGWSCPMLGSDGECVKFRGENNRGPRTPATAYLFGIENAA